jgi:hypothetical protein
VPHVARMPGCQPKEIWPLPSPLGAASRWKLSEESSRAESYGGVGMPFV